MMEQEQRLEAGTQTEEPPVPVSTETVVGQPDKPGTPAAAAPPTPRPSSSASCRLQTPLPRPRTSSRPGTAAAAAATPEPKLLARRRPKTAAVVLSDRTPMVLSHNPDPRLRNWQRLEHLRLHSLGLSSKLSRRCNVTRAPNFQPVGQRLPELPSGWMPPMLTGGSSQVCVYSEVGRKKNDVAPFKTFQKPTCGVYFTYETDNKKIKHDLQPTDLIKWRFFL